MSNDTTASASPVPAILLWIVVICALLYGVIETLTKVPALFGA
jgi:hypothetical protein